VREAPIRPLPPVIKIDIIEPHFLENTPKHLLSLPGERIEVRG
jgi:hypothetical protein